MSEQVILVDESDQQLGTSEKIRAHEQGLLHRAFSVYVFRVWQGALQLLLQQRHEDKYHCGGLWTNTCCSHPRPGESTIAAGQRRLMEEMGIKARLHHIGQFTYKAAFDNGLTEHEFDHVLVGIHAEAHPRFNPEEVSAYRWQSVLSILDELSDDNHQYTPWFEQGLRLALEQRDFIFSLLPQHQRKMMAVA